VNSTSHHNQNSKPSITLSISKRYLSGGDKENGLGHHSSTHKRYKMNPSYSSHHGYEEGSSSNRSLSRNNSLSTRTSDYENSPKYHVKRTKSEDHANTGKSYVNNYHHHSSTVSSATSSSSKYYKHNKSQN